MRRLWTGMGEELDERETVRQAQQGDREAFDRLTRRHLPRVYGFLFRMTGNHEDAEDLAQEALAQSFLSLPRFRGESLFSTWLYRIAIHTLHDHRRKEAQNHPLRPGEMAALPALGAGTDDPLSRLSQGELQESLSRSLEMLPHRLRLPLVLRVFDCLEYREIAAITGCSEGTVRVQVMKARRALIRKLGPWLKEGER